MFLWNLEDEVSLSLLTPSTSHTAKEATLDYVLVQSYLCVRLRVCVCVCVFACVCVCQKRCFKYALPLDELVGGLHVITNLCLAVVTMNMSWLSKTVNSTVLCILIGRSCAAVS